MSSSSDIVFIFSLSWLVIPWIPEVYFSRLPTPRGEGGTPIHYLYGYVPPNGVVILKLLILNGVFISEAFSRTGYNISNLRKLQFCKQPFEIIQGQIVFKNTVKMR